MSRIGNKPITVPENVEVKIDGLMEMIFQISDIIMICGSIVQDVMLMVSVDR